MSNTKGKKKTSRRMKDTFDPGMNPKSRRDLLDYDYLHKLNKNELEYLQKFTEEFVHANFTSDKRIHPVEEAEMYICKTRVTKKVYRDKYKKELADDNNMRNDDIINKFKNHESNSFSDDGFKSKETVYNKNTSETARNETEEEFNDYILINEIKGNYDSYLISYNEFLTKKERLRKAKKRAAARNKKNRLT